MRIERLIVGELQTNCYIIADEDGNAAVIDPGGNADEIASFIADEGLKLTKILLTHGHPDHLFAAGRLQQVYDVDLVMHEADVEQIDSNLEIAAMFYDMRQYVPPRISQFIQDGDSVSVGDEEFLVIHTPGHTPGGVCYLSGAALFAGDTLFAGSVGRTDLPGGNHDDLISSIRNRLLTLPDNTTVYPGHGSETTIGREKMFNPFVG